MTPDVVRRYRSQFRGVHSERNQGITVYRPQTARNFKAVEYVVCTDALRAVVVMPTGIAAYRLGEFVGWQPNVATAVLVAAGLR